MAIKNYTTISRTVKAVKYTGTSENFAELSDLSKSYDVDGNVIANYFLDGTLRLNIGEWLVKKADDEYDILTDEDFQLTYRQSRPNI